MYMYTYRFAFANAASIMVCNGIVRVRVRGSCINLCGVYLIVVIQGKKYPSFH